MDTKTLEKAKLLEQLKNLINHSQDDAGFGSDEYVIGFNLGIEKCIDFISNNYLESKPSARRN